MGRAYERNHGSWMTIQEVEEYLGICYQSWRNNLTPTNYDYSTNSSGMPKNLYALEDVLAFDDLMKYHENKDRYTTNDVSKLLGRCHKWVLQEITPTCIVKRGEKLFAYYDKDLIAQYRMIKSGIKIESNKAVVDDLIKEIGSLKNEIKELKDQKKKVKVSNMVRALLNCDVEIEM